MCCAPKGVPRIGSPDYATDGPENVTAAALSLRSAEHNHSKSADGDAPRHPDAADDMGPALDFCQHGRAGGRPARASRGRTETEGRCEAG